MNNTTLLVGIMSFIAGGMTIKGIQIVKDYKKEYNEIRDDIENEY